MIYNVVVFEYISAIGGGYTTMNMVDVLGGATSAVCSKMETVWEDSIE